MEINGETYKQTAETFEEMVQRHAHAIQEAGDSHQFGDGSGLGLLVQFLYEAKAAGLIEIKA